MKTFKLGQRVTVQKDVAGEAIGIDGTVVRICRSNDGAWVRLDQRHERCPFPADEDRGQCIRTFAQYCAPTKTRPPEATP